MVDFINTAALRRLCWEYLQIVLWHPQSAKIFIVALLAGLFCVAFSLAQFHGLGSSGRGSWLVGLLTTVVCFTGMIGGAALASLYFLPVVPNQNLCPTVMTILLLAGFFILVVPFTRTLFRTGYAISVASWLTALLVGVMVIFGVRYVLKPNHGDKPPNAEEIIKDLKNLKKQIPFLPPGKN